MASKRPHDRSNLEPNGRRKWQKTAASSTQQSQFKISPGTIVFRLLCPSSKSGSLIGKGGGIVTKIRQETGAKIKIEESVPGCDERVVVITGSDKETEVDNSQNKDNEEEKSNGENADEDEDHVEEDESNEEKVTSGSEPLQSEKAISSAQKALLLVFEKIAESDPESDHEDEESKESSSVTLRMLVQSNQVGCLLGKGGSVIKHMSAESGAQIRILPKDKLPSCASALDELVQITGQLDEVRKALQSVSQQLLENPPRDYDSSANKSSGPSSNPFVLYPRPEVPRQEMLPPSNFHLHVHRPPFPSRFHETADFLPPSMPRFPDGAGLGRLPISPEPLTFRLVCLNDKVGSVIGKGGSIVKMLQHETGCEIKIIETSADSEDRIIAITGPVLPDDRISPPQDAVLRVLVRTVTPAPDNKENLVLSRVLVSSNQTGCLLGKGGAIIAEMRRHTGAHIRILSKDQIPKCASENDEVVQIIGELETVQEAVLQITSRLKHHFFRDRFPSLNHPAHPGFVDQAPPFGPYMGRREPSPPGLYGPPFRKFDSVGGLRLHDERAFAQPSSMPWRAPGLGDGGGPMSIHDYVGGAPPRRLGGFPGGNQPAVITNTTVDVVVPRAVVSSIYGDDGNSLRQIRQISGANITITDPKPGATETVIIISGAPDQTHAAQSLIQAFVLSESGSP